jgi:hypothetical protein
VKLGGKISIPDDATRQRSRRFSRIWPVLLVVLLLLALGGVVVWGYLQGQQEAAREAERDQPVKVPLRLSTDESGNAVITLTPEEQARTGIETTLPRQQSYQPQQRAYATVLDLASFTTLANNVVTAKAELQAAEARLAASKAAYARAQSLYKEQQNVSQAQAQAAEAAFHADQAAVAVANSQLQTLQANAAQEWGPVLGQALADGAPAAERLISRQDVLVQMTLPAGTAMHEVPQSATILLGNSAVVPARYISPAPRTDRRIQGISFLYVASADQQLLPGMDLLVLLPDGPASDGVVIPPSAVVWWQGRAWIYVRTSAKTFTRREIATDEPAPAGGYIVRTLSPTTPLVTTGAQALLSEEFRAQIQVGEDQK